jgi:arsenical pump membrane protein
VVRDHDVEAGHRQFTRVGLATVPATLLMSVLALWASVRWFGA